MDNEQYLVTSYFLVAVFSIGLGVGVSLWLRYPFAGITELIATSSLPRLLRRFFPVGLILPALAGFLSVGYYGCAHHTTYEQIVADRAYLVAKNKEQISSAFEFVAVAVFVWVFLTVLALSIVRRQRPRVAGRTSESKHGGISGEPQ